MKRSNFTCLLGKLTISRYLRYGADKSDALKESQYFPQIIEVSVYNNFSLNLFLNFSK